MDEKSQIQALNRTQPGLPLKKGPFCLEHVQELPPPRKERIELLRLGFRE